MNLGTQKSKKARANFVRVWGDAAWRARGHALGMPTTCPRRVAAKAKAAPMGRQPRHGHAASKAKAAPHGHSVAKAWACSIQGLGEHTTAKAWACMLAWARWHAPGRRQLGPWGHAAKAVACRVPEGQWQHGEGVACPVGGMPRPWHALATPRRPWRHLGGLLLPSLDSLFEHLQLFPP